MRSVRMTSLAILLCLTACSDDDPPTFGGVSRTTLFTQTWAEGDLSALAYDPVTDALFLIEDVHGGQNVLYRWAFDDETLREVYRYTSQHDYGLRVFGDELWVTRTYDRGFLRLGSLDQDVLTLVGDHVFPGQGSKATEVDDVAMFGGNVLFVTGNPLGSDQHDGIQALVGPAYTSIDEVLSEAQAGWEVPSFSFHRAIVVVGSGAATRVAVTTGSRDGVLVVYDATGNEKYREAGLGESYLAKDSQDRVYAFHVDDGSLIRFSADFQEREVFDSDLPRRDMRFAVRETSERIELVYAPFRSEETPVRRVLLPK